MVLRETLSDYERGVLVGLLIGESSFTGDGRAPLCAISMHVRHESLLCWLHDLIPGSRLYGPYHHSGRDFFRWQIRGAALKELMDLVQDDVTKLCPHVGARMAQMVERYPRTFA